MVNTQIVQLKFLSCIVDQHLPGCMSSTMDIPIPVEMAANIDVRKNQQAKKENARNLIQ